MTTDHKTLNKYGRKTLFTTRDDEYRKRAGRRGYTGSKRQVHHILPCGSLTNSRQEFLDDHDEPHIAAMALDKITVFDVNAATNLIGLPTCEVYAKKYCGRFEVQPVTSAVIDAARAPAIASCDWPIHLWNHPAYSRAAKAEADKVWDAFSLRISEHREVSATDVGGALQNVSDTMKMGIEDPGKKALRTQAAWQSGNKAAFDII